MRLQDTPYLPSVLPDLIRQLDTLYRQIATQVNQLSEGGIVAAYNAATAAPTTGTYFQGDTIRNSSPSELGVAASMYVITGWICTVSGTPGTWLECRSLTGN